MARWSAWLGPGTDGEVSGTRIKGGVMYRSPLSTTKHAVKLCLLTSAPSKSDNLEEREAELSKIAAACHYFNYGHLSLKKMIYVENVIFWQNGQTKHQLRCCLSALDSILTKNIKSSWPWFKASILTLSHHGETTKRRASLCFIWWEWKLADLVKGFENDSNLVEWNKGCYLCWDQPNPCEHRPPLWWLQNKGDLVAQTMRMTMLVMWCTNNNLC